jgi:hypothetical protein
MGFVHSAEASFVPYQYCAFQPKLSSGHRHPLETRSQEISVLADGMRLAHPALS